MYCKEGIHEKYPWWWLCWVLVVGGGGNDRGADGDNGVRICPESFPCKNLLPRKVFAFSTSVAKRDLNNIKTS